MEPRSDLGPRAAVLPLLPVHDVHDLGVVRPVLHDVKQEFGLRLLVVSNLHNLLSDTGSPEDSCEEDDHHEELNEGGIPVGGVGGDGRDGGLQGGHHQNQAEQTQSQERRSPEVESFEEIIAE